MKIINSIIYLQNKILKYTKFPLILFFILIMLFNFIGCLKKNIKLATPGISFHIISKADTNGGEPCYIMIRMVNENNFLTDSYEEASKMIFANPPNESILTYDLILPYNYKEIKVNVPDKPTSLGLYCFFSEHSDKWKVLLPKPLKTKYKFVLEKNKIMQKTIPIELQKKEGFFNNLLKKVLKLFP